MTEQEAEELAKRLRWIWSGTKKTRLVRTDASEAWGTRLSLRGETRWDLNAQTQYFRFQTQSARNVFLLGDRFASSSELAFDLSRITPRSKWRADLDSLSLRKDLASTIQVTVDRPAFIEEWMPFFRRGCWLSGCAIEASAHEKAEWIQGFTHEELEAWNLNF